MAEPTIRAGYTYGNDGGNATTRNISYPSSISAGDLLVFAVQIDDGFSGGAPAVPSGWDAIDEFGVTGQWRGAVFAKVAVGDESGTFAFASQGSPNSEWAAWACFAVNCNGTATTSLIDGTVDETIVTNVPDPPNHTTTWGSADNLWVALVMGNGSGTWSASPGSGTYTDIYRYDGAAAFGPFWIGYRNPGAPTSSENPSTGTCSAGVEAAATYAIKSAAASAVPSISRHYSRMMTG